MRRLGFFTFLALFSASAHAYTFTRAQGGSPVKLSADQKMKLAGNPINASGLSADEVKNATARGLQRWESATNGFLSFDYWQGEDSSTYEPNSEYNGLSSFYFASNHSEGDAEISSNVIGLTQVWYDTTSGEILETDVVLNDIDFELTTEMSDSTGTGTASRNLDSKPQVFIENVLTHELGHAYGLSHSGELQSTMLFVEAPEQALLSCDDLAGIRALYPEGITYSAGSITGSLESSSGTSVFGAQVIAISHSRGVAIASAVTDTDGSFKIEALEPGDYYVMAEPFYGGASSLAAYYSKASSYICSGGLFGRTFATEADGHTLAKIEVKAGTATDLGILEAQCPTSTTTRASAIVLETYGSSELVQAPEISGEIRFIDKFSSTYDSLYYDLGERSGNLQIQILSFSLFSPVSIEASLIDESGEDVESASLTNPVFSSESGFENFDAVIEAENLPLGRYYLKVDATYLSSSLYPSGSRQIDAVPFFIVTSLADDTSMNASAFPVNARCESTESFSAYQSPTSDPVRDDVESSSGGIGACGTIQGPSGGGGAGPGAILGFFIPFLLMALSARAARLRIPLVPATV